MQLDSHSTDSLSLRKAVLETYISSSSGVHNTISKKDIDSYFSAYRYYLRDWLPTLAGKRWLDLGCGQGLLLRLAQTLGAKPFGIDVSAEMLTSCRNDNLDVRHIDIFAYLKQCEDQSWDIVSAFDLLEHFSKDDGFILLREIRRVLKPDGLGLLKMPNAYSLWGGGITANDLTHEAAYTAASLSQMAQLAGFAKVQVRELGPAPVSLISCLRFALWRFTCFAFRTLDTIEVGCPRTPIYTRGMLVSLVNR